MVLKNVPAKKLPFVFFSRLCLDGLAGINYFFKGKFSHTWAIVKAHFKVYSVMSRFLKKRESNQYKNYFKTHNIVYQYHFKKVRIFTEKFNNSL
jgi:hypothetical protein